MKRLLLILCLALAGAGTISAQTKAETSLYTKTMKKPSLKAYEKFLAKYPDSTYSLEILTLRDSTLFAAVDAEDAEAVEAFAEQHPDSPIGDQVAAIIERHNTSPLSRQEAEAIFADLVPDGKYATGWRQRNHDYVVGIAVQDGTLKLIRCAQGSDGQWSLEQTRTPERYTLDAALTEWRIDDDPEIVPIGGRRLIHYKYFNQAQGAKDIERVLCLYDWDNDILTNAMFYGRSLKLAADGAPQIEGQCPESAMAGGLMMPEMAYLLYRISEDPHLEQISKADALTDDSIKWWLEKNPTAQTRASKISFGALDLESSLVAGYKACRSRDKDSSKKFTAALFNIRDYTVIVAYSKTYNDYLLVWCEPVCVNKNRDQLLNTIYFEDDNTLDLFYYKGKTTFKYRINLATKAIRR